MKFIDYRFIKNNSKAVYSVILFLLSINSSFSQYDKPILYFKNGDTLQGERHAFLKDKVQFSKTLKSKPVKYEFKDIAKVEVISKRGGELTTYVREAVVGKKRKLTVELVEEGFLSYHRIKNYSGTDGNYFFDFYLKRADEDAMTFVGTDNPFKMGFKKKITEYLKDCNTLVNKIEVKEFRRKNMKEIVQYYNENCVKK